MLQTCLSLILEHTQLAVFCWVHLTLLPFNQILRMIYAVKQYNLLVPSLSMYKVARYDMETFVLLRGSIKLRELTLFLRFLTNQCAFTLSFTSQRCLIRD